MSDLCWLTDAQMERLRPFFPKSHGKPRVGDRRVLSSIVFSNRNGLRWGEAGMMEGLAAAGAKTRTVMIDATYLEAHRTASTLRVRKGISAA